MEGQENHHKNSSSQKGMTLIEVLVVATIAGILSIVIASAVNYGVLGQKGIDNLHNVTGYAVEMKQIFWKSEMCTLNLAHILGGSKSITEGRDIPIPRLLPLQKTGTTYSLNLGGEPLYDQDDAKYSVKSRIRLKEINLKVEKKITDKFYIGNVEMRFEALNRAIGAEVFNRSFPVAIGVAMGQFESCGGMDSDDGAITNDKICGIASESEMFWNGTNCQSIYMYEPATGDYDQVTCPSDTIIHSCDYPEAKDGDEPLVRIGKNGRQLPTRPPTTYEIDPATNTCYCDYPVDSTPTSLCTAQCKKQIYFP